MDDRATDLITLTFTNPFRGTRFDADASPDITGAEVIEALVREGLLDAVPRWGGDYVLVHARSGRSIARESTLHAQGVRSGDEVTATIHVPG